MIFSRLWIKASKPLRVVGIVAFCVVLFIGSMLIWQRNTELRDELTLWSITIQESPEYKKAQVNYGAALVNRGKYLEAIPVLEEATRHYPQDYVAWYSLGSAYLELYADEKAIHAYEKVVELLPYPVPRKYYVVFYNLGFLYEDKGMLNNAREMYQYALHLNPEHERSTMRLQALT